MAPIISMEELNNMLSLQRNHIVLGAGANVNTRLFRRVDAKSMFRSVVLAGKVVKRRVPYSVFDADGTIPDSQHPLHQFAIDGLVATRVEEVDDLNTYSTAAAQNVCTVAVKGHAPMRLEHVPSEIGLQSHAPAGNLYLQPIRILAKVFVVLVAVLVDKATQRWMLQYEVVSSSNLDVDPRFAAGSKLYRTNLSHQPNAAVAGDRLTLRVVTLGSVVDTRFGAVDQRQLTVCVNIAVFEPTHVIVANEPDNDDLSKTVKVPLRFPRAVFRAFYKDVAPKVGKSAGVGLGASAGLRRLQTGDRPSTGAGAAEFAALRQAVSDMTLIVTRLSEEVQQQQVAIHELEGRSEKVLDATQKLHKEAVSSLDELKKQVGELNNINSDGFQAVQDSIKQFFESHEELLESASEILIRDRLYAWIDAIIDGTVKTPTSAADKKLAEFAQRLVEEYDLEDGYLPFTDTGT